MAKSMCASDPRCILPTEAQGPDGAYRAAATSCVNLYRNVGPGRLISDINVTRAKRPAYTMAGRPANLSSVCGRDWQHAGCT